jgi:GNAT superfamily N-acetyltransferase
VSIKAVARAFELVGDPRDQELLYWQYLKPPGGAYLAVAHDDRGLVDGVAAIYAAFPTIAFDGSSESVFIQSFDTLTLPAYRGRGLMDALATRVYEAAVHDGAQVVYGIPNSSSLPVFTKRLNWSIMDPLPMLARPVGLRYPRVRLGLRRPTPPHRSRQVDIPVDLDELTATDRRLGPVRSAEYFKWRLDRPGSTYRTHEIRDSSNRLDSWAVSELVLKHGCALGYVIEILVRRGADVAGRKNLRDLTSDLALHGADLILAWALPGPERSCLLRNGFVPIPERLRPIELHFGARSLSDDDSVVTRRSSWRLSYVDSDTI